MNSTPSPKAIEPDDVLVARADQRLAHAYAQIARADEQIARVNEQISKLDQGAAPDPSAVLSRRPARSGSLVRGLIGLLLAAGIFLACFRLAVALWRRGQTDDRRLDAAAPFDLALPPERICRADEPVTHSVGRGGAGSRAIDQLRRRLLRRTSRRRPPRWRPSWRSCSRRWRVTSQTRSRASNSSRRARNRRRVKMPGRSRS